MRKNRSMAIKALLLASLAAAMFSFTSGTSMPDSSARTKLMNSQSLASPHPLLDIAARTIKLRNELSPSLLSSSYDTDYMRVSSYTYAGGVSTLSSGYIYYNSSAGVNVNTCACIEIMYDSLISNEISTNIDLHVTLKGNLTTGSYALYDYVSSSWLSDTDGNSLTFDTSSLTTYGGSKYLLVFRLTSSSSYGFVNPMQCRWNVSPYEGNYSGTTAPQNSFVLNYPTENSFSDYDRPLVVTIHGGYWGYIENEISCNEHYFDPLTDSLTSCGYAHANIRFSTTADSVGENTITIPKMLTDINTALNYFAEMRGIDRNRVCLWGYSSGGHLAALYATGNTSYLSEANNMITIKYLVMDGAPLDLYTMYLADSEHRSQLETICGFQSNDSVADKIAKLNYYSPVNHYPNSNTKTDMYYCNIDLDCECTYQYCRCNNNTVPGHLVNDSCNCTLYSQAFGNDNLAYPCNFKNAAVQSFVSPDSSVRVLNRSDLMHNATQHTDSSHTSYKTDYSDPNFNEIYSSNLAANL